jgi:hypothetical protein
MILLISASWVARITTWATDTWHIFCFLEIRSHYIDQASLEFFFFFSLWYWGLNSGLWLTRQVLYDFQPCPQSLWELFFFFLVVVLGFELRASYLLGRCSTTWPTAPISGLELLILPPQPLKCWDYKHVLLSPNTTLYITLKETSRAGDMVSVVGHLPKQVESPEFKP